jgi:ribokinase
MRVAVVGHVEWVWFGSVDRIPGPGDIAHATDEWEEPAGGGAVAAVQLAKLASACDLFTALGEDEIGLRAREELAALGLDVHAELRDDRTRRALTLVDPAGERTITTLGHRLEASGSDPLPWERLEEADAVYVTAGDADAFRFARRAGVMVVTTRVLEALLEADVVPDALVGSANDPAEHIDVEMLPWRPPVLVLTEGRSGGRYETSGGGTGRFEGVEVRGLAGDAYGAGDSFAGGLTYALGAGWQLERSLAFAARCGASCAAGRGPYSGQLGAADL